MSSVATKEKSILVFEGNIMQSIAITEGILKHLKQQKQRPRSEIRWSDADGAIHIKSHLKAFSDFLHGTGEHSI